MQTIRKKINRKKITVIVGIALLLLLLLGDLLFLSHRHTAPDPGTMKPLEAVKYMASKQFAALPEAEQERYLNIMRTKSGDRPGPSMFKDLSKEEQEALHKNTGKFMRREMRERINKFFTMSQAEQDAFLDNMIKEREARRKADEQNRRNSDGGNPPGGRPPGAPNKAMMQNMLENTDSTTRARMAEFHRRMQERMKQQQGR